MDLSNKTELISYLKSHGLYTKSSLGQNFLVDKNSLDKIVEAAELDDNDLVMEIGSGLGTLTSELVKHSERVFSVELDERLANLLACNFSIINSQLPTNNQCQNDQFNNWVFENSMKVAKLKIDNSELSLVQGDILNVNIPELVGDKPYKVVANIPYYITSRIIQFFLTQQNKPLLIVLLVQKEVAERITSSPGGMSVLSLSVQSYGEPEIVDIVPKSSFFPAPKVDSAILKIKNIKFKLNISEQDFFRIVKIGFASRRKTLINNLAAGLHLDKEKARSIIEKIGLKENIRAQELNLEQWESLVKAACGS